MFDFIIRLFCPTLKELNKELESSYITIDSLNDDIESYKNIIFELEEESKFKDNEIIVLKSQIPKIDDLEYYWNNKRSPSNDYRYSARKIWGLKNNVGVDVRLFFTPNDNLLPKIDGNNDEKAFNALRYVKQNITYTTDKSQFKEDEEWLLSFETLNLCKGDCEDGAILLANILLHNNVPYWRVRLNAGDVQGGGHCWVTYLRESDNKWIILDWCYWFDDSIKGLVYNDAEKYYNIWFSFNKDNIYLNESFDREKLE